MPFSVTLSKYESEPVYHYYSCRIIVTLLLSSCKRSGIYYNNSVRVYVCTEWSKK